jgi:hypothetical protein
MRKLSALSPALALPVLLAATVLIACGGGDDDTTAPRHGSTSSDRSTTSTRETTSTTTEPEAVAAEPADASPSPGTPPAASTPQPSGGDCDTAVVHDTIASSDAVAPDLTFEITYLNCADGYGWAQIAADIGETATVILEGSGTDITLLNLGSSVCPTDSGMPVSIATQLAPPGSNWLGECET